MDAAPPFPTVGFELPDESDPAQVLGATLYLLQQCVTEGACPGRAKAVFMHLRWLARQPASDPRLSQLCAALAARWVRWRFEQQLSLGGDGWGEPGRRPH